MIFNSIEATLVQNTPDTVQEYHISDSVNGMWYGQYYDNNGYLGWLELSIEVADTLVTGRIAVIEQGIHGQTRVEGVVSGTYELRRIKLNIQLKESEKILRLSGFHLGMGINAHFLGCYDVEKVKMINISSGSWTLQRTKKH